MGIPCDDMVQIRPPKVAGEPTVIAINCPDKIGLGCDLCRVILFFAEEEESLASLLLLLRFQFRIPLAFLLLLFRFQFRNLGCLWERKPANRPQDVTQVLCKLELTILKVKVSTTPDGKVMDLLFITDTRELLHTRKRKEETCDQLKSILGDFMTSCEIEPTSGEITACLEASPFLPPELSEEMFNLELPQEETEGSDYKSDVPTVTVNNSLSPGRSLIQILCQDHKGLFYDVMRTLKDYNIQLSYGRFYTAQKARCEIDLFVVQMDGKKILDHSKQKALCDRLRMEMYKPLRVMVVNRGPDTELVVANPVELSGKGRPLVFHDITLTLKMLHTQIFLAGFGRHVNDREWEVYRILFGEDESSAVYIKIVEGVTKMLMGWE